MTKRTTVGPIGLVALAILVLVLLTAVNLLFRGWRVDLTENNLYTLSDGTRNVLAAIDEPLNVYFFFSDRATANIPQIRTYANRVRETLLEFEELSGGKLTLQVIDPLPFSEEEDRAAGFGLQGISLPGAGDPVYLGIAGTNSVGDEETIPFLDPGKETFLEYDLTRMIWSLTNPERPVIGLVTDLPMAAGFDPVSRQPRQPWLITSEIQQLFEVRTLSTTVDRIDEDIDVLMVVHPKSLGEASLYAIDQFILGGGRALIAVDPYAEIDIPQADPANPAAAMMASRSSNLNRILATWGLSVDPDRVIADEQFALTVSGFGGRPTRHIGLIGIGRDGLDQQDVVTAGVDSANLGYSGFIEVADDAAVTVSPLIESSQRAGPIETTMLGMLRDPAMLFEEFEPTGETYLLGARISGQVESAFPQGPPDGVTAPESGLTRAEAPINVILLADTDLLSDRLWAQAQNFFGQRIVTPFAGNGSLVVNALDNLAGSSDLIGIRGRQTFARPFTRVEALRLDAEAQYRLTEESLQQQLQETEARLTELQSSRDDQNALILSPEQQEALEIFQQERLRIRKELRQVRRNLDRDIEDLGTTLKVINIGLIPAIISLLSIGWLVIRKRRHAGVRP